MDPVEIFRGHHISNFEKKIREITDYSVQIYDNKNIERLPFKQYSLLSSVISFQNLKCDVPGKFQLDPLDIVLRSPKIAKFLNLEW